MAAQKGHKKWGGRAKGTPNKNTQNLLSICEEEGVDPFRAMLIAAKQITNCVDKVNAYEKICQYLYPKRKALELDGAGEDGGIKIQIFDYGSKQDE